MELFQVTLKHNLMYVLVTALSLVTCSEDPFSVTLGLHNNLR